jgi:uncharacterized repeat protein (TIGR03803 family)
MHLSKKLLSLSAAASTALLVGCSSGASILPKPESPRADGITGTGSIARTSNAIGQPGQGFNMLLSFDGPDGNGPYAALVQGNDGNLYGTTSEGGTGYISGTVFKITPSGVLTTLHNFSGPDGFNPTSALLQASDGYFYGTTEGGGSSSACQFGCGTVFRISQDGRLKTLHSFVLTDGAYPYAALVQGKNGDLYGTTSYGGANNIHGTVFKITPSGTLTTLHSFDGTDGSESVAGLMQANDGNFYGTTEVGGHGFGTVFKITPSGQLTTLHNFDGSDGGYPTAGLVQAANGRLYGTTEFGKYRNDAHVIGNQDGTIFKITLSGRLTKMYKFQGTDGRNPYAGLIQATDGNFYGTTLNGGASNYGAVFKMTPNGTLTTIYSFQNSQAYPFAGLIQATNGKLYGTTYEGGTGNCGGFFCGMIFSLSP